MRSRRHISIKTRGLARECYQYVTASVMLTSRGIRSIKVGTLSQTSAQVSANLKSALPAVVKAIKGGWDNIQSFHIKTNTSTSLPIWSCDLGSEDSGRWAGLTNVVVEEDEGVSDEDESEEEVEKKKPKTRSEKGKKRAAEDDEEEQPKKKVKATIAPEPASEGSKKKRRGNAVEDPGLTTTPATTEAKTSSTNEPAKKKKRKPEAALSSSVSSTSQTDKSVDSIPITPSASKKKSRAQATDFFDDAETTPASTRIAPPPNTPADGLDHTSANPKKKKKGKNPEVEQTPVSRAIEQLTIKEDASHATAPSSSDAVADEVAKEVDGTKPAKKARHKKNKGSAVEVAVESAEQTPAGQTPAVASAEEKPVPEDGEKKKKRKKKAQESEVADAAPSVAASAVTVDEVKQKLGASGVEKKKEKAVKAGKRRAKDAVLGTKGV